MTTHPAPADSPDFTILKNRSPYAAPGYYVEWLDEHGDARDAGPFQSRSTAELFVRRMESAAR